MAGFALRRRGIFLSIEAGSLQYILEVGLEKFEADLRAAERMAATSAGRMAGSLGAYDAAISRAAKATDALGNSRGTPQRVRSEPWSVRYRLALRLRR